MMNDVVVYLSSEYYNLPVSVDLNASVSRLKDYISATFGVPDYMQCMYFEDTCLHHDLRTLRDIGLSQGSVIQFCVDGEITAMRCHFQDQVITRNRSERCHVLDVCQDVYAKLRKNGFCHDKNELLRLTIHGIHLDDNVQLCFYPELHIYQQADVQVEIIQYSTMENGQVMYANSPKSGNRWIVIQVNESSQMKMSVSHSVTCEEELELIRTAFSQLFIIPTKCLSLKRLADQFYALFVVLPFTYEGELFEIKVPFESTVQDVCDQLTSRLAGEWTFGGCEYQWMDINGTLHTSQCTTEPVSCGYGSHIRLWEVIRNHTLYRPLAVGVVRIQNICNHSILHGKRIEGLLSSDMIGSCFSDTFSAYDYTEVVDTSLPPDSQSLHQYNVKDVSMSVRPLLLSPTRQIIKRNWYIKSTDEKEDEDDLFVLNTLLGMSDYFVLNHLEVDLNSGKDHFSFWREGIQPSDNANKIQELSSNWKCRLYDLERLQFHCM